MNYWLGVVSLMGFLLVGCADRRELELLCRDSLGVVECRTSIDVNKRLVRFYLQTVLKDQTKGRFVAKVGDCVKEILFTKEDMEGLKEVKSALVFYEEINSELLPTNTLFVYDGNVTDHGDHNLDDLKKFIKRINN